MLYPKDISHPPVHFLPRLQLLRLIRLYLLCVSLQLRSRVRQEVEGFGRVCFSDGGHAVMLPHSNHAKKGLSVVIGIVTLQNLYLLRRL
jgi:hypothetical protein